MKTYKIIEILHSGRKGIRNTPVKDSKYNQMIGSIIECDLEYVEQFKPLKWWFKDHPFYEVWHTSEVLALLRDFENDLLYLETVNTIYVLKEII